MKIIVKIWVLWMVLGIWACRGSVQESIDKNKAAKEKFVTTNPIPESKDKKELDSILIPKEQLELINRKGFDKSVLSYDTTELIHTDSLPFRLLSQQEIHKRLPWKRKIAGYLMTKNGIGYDYKDRDWHIKTRYPGVVGYYPTSWGDYAKKVEYYDQNENLIRTINIDSLTPYKPSQYKNIKPGSFDFESMAFEKGFETDDYITKASSFRQDRYINLQTTTNWIVANYKLIALDDLNRVIGYEATLEIYDEKGKTKYKKKLPFSIQYPFISTDNKYLVYAPARANYMPKANNMEGELFVVDLDSGETIFIQKFQNKRMKFSAFIEHYRDNLLSISFTNQKPKKELRKTTHCYLDILNKQIFCQDYKIEKEKYGNDLSKHPLEKIIYKITKY